MVDVETDVVVTVLGRAPDAVCSWLMASSSSGLWLGSSRAVEVGGRDILGRGKHVAETWNSQSLVTSSKAEVSVARLEVLGPERGRAEGECPQSLGIVGCGGLQGAEAGSRGGGWG